MTLRSQPKFQLNFQPWPRPFQRPFQALRSLTLGAIAISGAALLPGSGVSANPPSAIAQPNTPPTAIAQRSVPLVLLADLVSQPERWQGQLIRTIGRLQPGQTAVDCTEMACTFPDTARVGDQQPCNRCFGSAVLQDDRAILVLDEVRCQGVEILTYRGSEPIERTIRWQTTSLDSRTFNLGSPYVVVGTLQPRPIGDSSEPAATPLLMFQVQSIEPVGSGNNTQPGQPGVIPGLW